MPTKMGGGNKPQEYNTNNGEYIKFKHFGKPSVVQGKTFYHGSPNKYIQAFDESKAGTNVGTDYAGIFFTDNKDFAEEFSYERQNANSMFFNKKGEKGKVYEAELDIKKPLDLNNLTNEMKKDIKEKYLVNNGLGNEENFKMFNFWLDRGNIQGAKALIDFKKVANDNKYDGYIADLGDKYKGSNEYVIFKGSQAKLKNPSKEKEPTKKKENNIDDLPF